MAKYVFDSNIFINLQRRQPIDVHGNCGAREKRHAAEMRRVRTKAWMQKQAEEEENGR